ncbi:glycosyltransferase family 4 protein [Sphingobium ummariense]|uniref:Uncharacterized protein n=1 Tax=Sphingobium ummariense RL-3 TaxID=1346791 RepID=T0K8S7_9SPHN|nr:glycosyltransferase family 1 protein [Sphingobium ummariense]EQB33084.1 hypothetical protein M529_06015 [Sphingobium ummariense RL-3]
MGLKVALSVEALSPRLSGIGRYNLELVRRLREEPGLEALRFYRGTQWIEAPERLLMETSPAARRWLRLPRPLRVARDRRVGRGHVFHGPNYFLPDWVEGGVVTVHDLSILRFPETHPEERRRYFERRFADSLARTAHVVTDSETMRREAVETLSLDPERVTAVPLGVDARFHPRSREELAGPLARHGLSTDGYALCVSTVEPRKRIAELLLAWERLPASVRSRWPLMVTGGEGWLSDAVRAAMERGAREGWVRYLGYVPEEELPLLYAGAALFVYPSIYEGFGLPPVEAMASGVPALVANASCLPEVTGAAAMLVEPEDIAGFSAAIEQALTDAAWRAKATATGLEVASAYGWDRCVRETVRVYEAVAANL